MKVSRPSVSRLVGLTATIGLVGLVLGCAGAAQQQAAPAPAPTPEPEATPSLPAARTIIDRHIEASGGQDAILSHTTRHATGTFEMPSQGLSGDMEVFAQAPNKTLFKLSIPGLGDISQGFDGEVGWAINPAMGPMVLEGKMLDQARREADFYSDLHDPSKFTSIETVEQVEFDGQQCYKLKLVTISGEEYFEFYNSEDGLQVGSMATQETPMGSMDVTTVIGGYRQFGNLLLPTTLSQTFGPGIEQLFTVTSYDDLVEESVFELPDEIKALLQK